MNYRLSYRRRVPVLKQQLGSADDVGKTPHVNSQANLPISTIIFSGMLFTFLKTHLNIESDDVLFPAALIHILETISIGAGPHFAY